MATEIYSKYKPLSVKGIKLLLGITPSTDSKVVLINPNQAKTLLEKTNRRNRKLRASRVSEYARAIRKGHWHLTQDAISFDSEGVLTNGQHRLTAIAMGDTAVPVLVAFGIEASTAIDTGAKRSFTDNVKIGNSCDARIKENRTIHRVFKTAYAYSSGNYVEPKITPDEMTELMNKYADYLLVCEDAGLFGKISTKGCDSVVIKSSLFLAYMNGVDIRILNHLVEILKSGVSETKCDSPIIGLRDILMPKSGGGREVNYERLCYTQSCISKLCRKSRTKKLELAPVYTYKF